MQASLPLFVGLRYAYAGRGGLLVAFLSRISVLGLILGVALLIIVLSVMNGFEKELQTRILNLVPHASVQHYDLLEDWRSADALVKRHPEVAGTAPYIHVQALLSAGNNVEGVLLHSVLPALENKLSNLQDYLAEGSLSELKPAANGVVLGDHVARKLGVEVGSKLRVIVPQPGSNTVNQVPRIVILQVVGIFHTGTEMDHSLGVIHLQDGQALLGYGQKVQGIRLQLNNVFDAPRVGWEIVQNLPPGYYAQDWQRTHGNLYEAIQLSRSMVTLLIFMVITVAVFNVVSSLVMVVNDKRGDIAILRTLGASDRNILHIFVIQGLIIGVLGTLLGVAFGCTLAWLIPDLIVVLERVVDYQFLNSTVYPIDYLPTDVRVRDVIIIAVAALVMSLFATLYPARRATRVRPAEALRWEG
ncbi:MAG: lipoprotein-releasing ABC transporter permease subunit [Pseudomonadales bacterium]